MKLIFTEFINSEQDLQAIAEKVKNIAADKNAIILLSGPLAAGKTTFVIYFCRLFNIQHVQSPTYALHQRYQQQNLIIDHIDLYRLETEEAVQASGFYDVLNMVADYKFIEWPERIQLQDLPLGIALYKIKIHMLLNESRQIEFYDCSA